MTKDQALQLKEWWDLVGSGITPAPEEDQEEHARRVAYRAYSACLEHTTKGDNNG